ncbi:MAG TPA: FAD-dependent oxidoreductase, partial [Nevskia sp.]|nr:FAD-dependent oxidoreductase [Nevskia sp.]
MDRVDCVVIGAGVIGLAVARQLARAGLKPLIIERHHAIGMETSSRNSEVIHAGLYYPRDSLKARLCLRGRELLYAYCAERGIAHRRCGKLVVAADPAQEPALLALLRQAHDNGAQEVEPLDAGAARALEPELHCAAALLSPATGILDTHAYMLALLGEAEQWGATLAASSAVTGLRLHQAGIEISVDGEPEPLLRARRLVNAAGLHAIELARSIEGLASGSIPLAH